MLRRLHSEQPDSFAFTDANRRWAEAQIKKYPEGRQASAIIPLLWRAQEQEGWLSRPAIEHVADMLGMAYIRALEVATFYFMFQLQPVGSVAHVQVCGTLSCMICGAEDLIGVCKDKIAPKAHALSADGRFSWEEVECLGACANAPMVQIGKDYYEDLTAESLADLLDRLAAGEVPVPGPQNGRYASEPKSGLTSLKEWEEGRNERNASAALATEIGDTIRRIDGTEVPLVAPWLRDGGADESVPSPAEEERIEQSHPGPRPSKGQPADATGVTEQEAEAASRAKPRSKTDPVGDKAAEMGAATGRDDGATKGTEPERLEGPRDGKADDLKRISGIGPRIEAMLNETGFWHFSQIASWGPAEIAWVDSRLSFRGRIEREGWVEQATSLQAD
ncbi:NADH-quinone oxidoreductase subunit E [Wenxinia marina]|uniref:NADH dehydrogenase subunit E n=1 Tax=Wenxinia marina DSM 24838 TaxID=1123501 RepID=A0A0D0NNN7_9RHOB|nr:NADH-quinone oxidoreductase subunit E [Wenxinia marina]KIQ69885.1 NADH dehydrogenase subunit E [Wenxinia marina DSM 24838]GGL61987.1 NADH-quinone oxidoreductase subunit E [Wenxinia marina]